MFDPRGCLKGGIVARWIQRVHSDLLFCALCNKKARGKKIKKNLTVNKTTCWFFLLSITFVVRFNEIEAGVTNT